MTTSALEVVDSDDRPPAPPPSRGQRVVVDVTLLLVRTVTFGALGKDRRPAGMVHEFRKQAERIAKRFFRDVESRTVRRRIQRYRDAVYKTFVLASLAMITTRFLLTRLCLMAAAAAAAA